MDNGQKGGDGVLSAGSPPASRDGEPDDLVASWKKFIRVMLDPYTLMLTVVAVVLGCFGPKAIGESYNALLQVVIALMTGVVGARMATSMAALNQEGKLYSNGRMAVRGLRLILTRTIALERRVAIFVSEAHREEQPEVKAAVARRNLDEVMESIRTLQTEIAGSIENWVEIVPSADLSALFNAVADLREQLSRKEVELSDAVSIRTELESKGTADAESLRNAENRIAELERQRTGLEASISTLRSAATRPGNLYMTPVNTRAAIDHLILNQSLSWADESPNDVRSVLKRALENWAPDVATEKHKLPE